MNSPQIKQWQSRPIQGGWGLSYELMGQSWSITSSNPYNTVAKIAQIQRVNGQFDGEGPIWDYCNAIWAARDPARALVGGKLPKKAEKIPSKGHWDHGPELFGPCVWGWLHSFGMVFDEQGWKMAIERITRLLDPEQNPLNGCSMCHGEWLNIIATSNPEEVTDEVSAASWGHTAHNRVNRKLGKPVMPFSVAARKYGWKVEL
jgi:hypothetical protein